MSERLGQLWHSAAGRLSLAGGVLLAEYLAISLRVDAYTVGERGGVWSSVAHLGSLAPLLVVFLAALLLARQGDGRSSIEPKLTPALLFAHPLVAGAFFWLSLHVFGGTTPEGSALLWLSLWSLVGLSSAVTLVVGLISDRRWLTQQLKGALLTVGGLGVVAWLAGVVSPKLWPLVSQATFVAVAHVLELFGFELFAEEAKYILELEGFAVAVAPVCSGMEGIGLYLALISGFLWKMRRELKFPTALLLLPVGTALIWIGNTLRIASLMVLGARVDAQLALGSFHSKAGWVFFCVITLIVAGLSRRIPFLWSFPRAERDEGENVTAPFIVPLLVWMGVGLATSAFNEGHDPLYGLRVVATAGTLFIYRRHYVELLQRPSLVSAIIGVVVGIAWLVIPILWLVRESAAPDFPGWQGVAWVFARSFGAIVLIPLCEEIAFRGYLPRFFQDREFWRVDYSDLRPAGILLSSVAFATVHEMWHLALATGIVYALLLKKTGRLIDAVVAHAASNATIALWVLVTGDYQHW